MTLTEAIPLLVAEYWRQCHPDYFTGEITARLESIPSDPDEAVTIEIELSGSGRETALFCWREQYGQKSPCSMPACRGNWELKR
jgi:hypothetical protein